MTRETKVGLLVGMGIILLIGIIVSDHLAIVNEQRPADLMRYASGAQESLGPVKPTHVNSPAPVSQAELVARQRGPMPMPGEFASSDSIISGSTAEADPQVNRWLVTGSPEPRDKFTGATGHVQTFQTAKDAAIFVSKQLKERESTQHEHRDLTSTMGRLAKSSLILTVEAGQTLSELAAEHLGSSKHWPQLLAANRDQMSEPRQLREGMKLRIPAAQVEPSVERVVSLNRQAIVANPKSRYIVRAGDTLYGIARRHLGDGDRWRLIYEANKQVLASPSQLRVGQILAIPAG